MGEARDASRGENRTRRILLIDDDTSFVEVISTYLRECGHAVEAVSSGLEALASLGRGRPDVILLDLHLPGIKGSHVLKHLSQADSTIPVFVVTGNADDAPAVEALQKLAAGYVPKSTRLAYLNHLVALQHTPAAETVSPPSSRGPEPNTSR